MYEIMSDLGKYLVNRYALCLKGSNMPRPPLYCHVDYSCSQLSPALGVFRRFLSQF